MRWVKVAILFVVCIFAMQYLHELGHALMSKSLGYDIVMSVNKVVSAGGDRPVPLLHSQLITAAGPAATIALSLLAFVLRTRLGMLAPIILCNAMVMRMIAAAASVSHPNDEAWLSESLGLGMWTLPAAVCALLAGIFIAAVRERKLLAGWYIAAWAGVSVGYSAVVFGETVLPRFAF